LLAFAGHIGILPLAGLAVAALVAVASMAPLWKRNLRRTPLFTWGMVLAHLGCAVSLAGMAADAAFTRENLVAARPGETHAIGPFEVTFAGLREVPGPNYNSLEGVLIVQRKGSDEPFLMLPHLRQFSDPPMLTNQAAIETFWNGQLYLTIGEKEMQGRWLLRLWWKPFVTLIWIGGMMMALGGALAILGRVKRDVIGRAPVAEAQA
jgi:cytochrome c-type biogenesis protein CcmF